MSGSIKLFLKLRNVYKTMGIYQRQTKRRFNSNPKNIFFLFCLAQMLISILAYSYAYAKSINEYGIVFFAGITLLNSINNFCLQIWNGPKIFRLIEHLERFIEMSKLQNCSTN